MIPEARSKGWAERLTTQRHVLPQHLIHPRLPAFALLPVRLQNVRVEAQGLVDLADFLLWAAGAAAEQFLRCGLADVLRQYLGCWPGTGEIFRCPFRVILVRPGCRFFVRFAIFCVQVNAMRVFATAKTGVPTNAKHRGQRESSWALLEKEGSRFRGNDEC